MPVPCCRARASRQGSAHSGAARPASRGRAVSAALAASTQGAQCHHRRRSCCRRGPSLPQRPSFKMSVGLSQGARAISAACSKGEQCWPVMADHAMGAGAWQHADGQVLPASHGTGTPERLPFNHALGRTCCVPSPNLRASSGHCGPSAGKRGCICWCSSRLRQMPRPSCSSCCASAAAILAAPAAPNSCAGCRKAAGAAASAPAALLHKGRCGRRSASNRWLLISAACG